MEASWEEEEGREGGEGGGWILEEEMVVPGSGRRADVEASREARSPGQQEELNRGMGEEREALEVGPLPTAGGRTVGRKSLRTVVDPARLVPTMASRASNGEVKQAGGEGWLGRAGEAGARRLSGVGRVDGVGCSGRALG